MPNSLWRPFREGNRSEYLAQYFLSALGVAAPVLRQEDIGVDFHCALAEECQKRLTFHSPFLVQVGSKGAKEFSYGGLDRKHRWQGEQIEWLFSQELPLFLCVIDKAQPTMELYSTSPMWLVRYQYGTVCEVKFEIGADGNPLDVMPEIDPKYNEHADGCRHRVPLPKPIVCLAIRDLNDAKIEEARRALKAAVELEAGNITYRRLQVHFAKWFPDPSSLGAPESRLFANDEVGRNTTELLRAARPILTALALNYHFQGRREELEKLKGVFELYPEPLSEALRGILRV